MSGTARRALVTGDTGFVGRHLVVELLAAGWAVVGVSTSSHAVDAHEQYDHLAGNLLDATLLDECVARGEPNHVFHLAGLVGANDPCALFKQNPLMTRLLLGALLKAHTRPWTLVVSSSAVYGNSRRQPIDESTPPAPVTDYATSKAAQELVALQFRNAEELPILVARPFNLVGPGQQASLVLSEAARQVAVAEAGGQGELRLGNLRHRRDFLDVRDLCSALVALATRDTNLPICNVASGRSTPVAECVNHLLTLAAVPLHVALEPSLIRTVDIADQVGDAALLRNETGWEPEIGLERSLSDLLGWWRQRVREKAAR